MICGPLTNGTLTTWAVTQTWRLTPTGAPAWDRCLCWALRQATGGVFYQDVIFWHHPDLATRDAWAQVP